jgi:hypothetical protein
MLKRSLINNSINSNNINDNDDGEDEKFYSNLNKVKNKKLNQNSNSALSIQSFNTSNNNNTDDDDNNDDDKNNFKYNVKNLNSLNKQRHSQEILQQQNNTVVNDVETSTVLTTTTMKQEKTTLKNTNDASDNDKNHNNNNNSITSNNNEAIFEYLTTEQIKKSENPTQDLIKVMHGLEFDEWPAIFHTLNVLRQLALHHQHVLLDNEKNVKKLHSIVVLIMKQVDNLRSSAAKNALLSISDLFIGFFFFF